MNSQAVYDKSTLEQQSSTRIHCIESEYIAPFTNGQLSVSGQFIIPIKTSIRDYSRINPNVWTNISIEDSYEVPIQNDEFTIGFYNDNYDVILERPQIKTIRKKIIVKSISKTYPRPVI